MQAQRSWRNWKNHTAADHKGRYTVGKTFVNHKISGIADHSGMNPGGIPHQVIEPVSAGAPCRVLVQAIYAVQDIRMVRHLKIRHCRFTKFLDLNIFCVIPAYRKNF